MATTEQLTAIRMVVTSVVREQPRLNGFFEAMMHELGLVSNSLEHIGKSANPEARAEISRLIQSVDDLSFALSDAINDPSAKVH